MGSRRSGGFRQQPNGWSTFHFTSAEIPLDVLTDGVKSVEHATSFMRKAAGNLDAAYADLGLSFYVRDVQLSTPAAMKEMLWKPQTDALQVLFCDDVLPDSYAGHYFIGRMALRSDANLSIPLHEVAHMLVGGGHHLPRVGCILDTPSPEHYRTLCADYCMPIARKATACIRNCEDR